MYIDNNWIPVEGEELAGFLERVGVIGEKYKVNPATTRVDYRMLPFYDQVAMIRVNMWMARDFWSWLAKSVWQSLRPKKVLCTQPRRTANPYFHRYCRNW